jgi:hypothetical protein
LSLAKECYSIKLDLLTNATAVDDTIRFVSHVLKEKIKSASENNKESNESDYNGDEKLEEQHEKGYYITTKNIIFFASRFDYDYKKLSLSLIWFISVHINSNYNIC